MENQQANSRTLSGPRDKSIEAYKVWIREIAQRLTVGADPVRFTEIEWQLHWREYWKENLVRES
jgi:hypothetical protein